MRKSGLALIILLVILGSGFGWQLPEARLPQPSTLYDVQEREIRGLAERDGINVSLQEIPRSFQDAIIVMEDKKFYRHHGFDLVGVGRAVYLNLKNRRVVAGGSTITQQTAKNLYLSHERTFSRKLKELFYAFQLERRYSKDEILALYCNTIYFGEGAYGVEMAARTYFGKHARELNVAEAALLAGLPNWPSQYDPYLHPEKARERQHLVLQRMVEEGKLTSREQRQAQEQPLEFNRIRFLGGDAPYFVAMVKDYLVKKYGQRMVYQGGLRVYTTLDQDMQQAANQAVASGLEPHAADLQAALVAVDPANGELRALVGGRDFTTAPFNRAWARRQPGSTFKPFMYSLGIAWGFTPADTFMCEEVSYRLPSGEVYKPTDYGKEPYHWRRFTLKEAVMISDNVVAVQVNRILGPKETARHAEKFGFQGIEPVLSLPLGSNEVRPVDMAAGYSVFANRGVYSQPYFILRVEDKQGRVLEANQPIQRRVIDPTTAYIVTDIMKGVMGPGGTGARLRTIFDREAAGKTGTTDEFRDAWFVGYTPQLCCSVWVGYDQKKTVNLPGGAVAGPIWAGFMRGASARLPEGTFARPADIEMVNICLDSGLVACESCPRTVPMAFKKGTAPEEICWEHGPRWPEDKDKTSSGRTKQAGNEL